MAAFIPEQLFVTFKKERLEDIPLGFASPFTKDAAFRKRRDTQLKWAYQHTHTKVGEASEPAVAMQRERYRTSEYGNRYNAYIHSPSYRLEGDEIELIDFVRDETLPEVTASFDQSVKCTNYRAVALPKDHDLYPKVLDNVPQAGFKFTEEVRRVYWGGGNVVWRVLDPRGFQLEISSSNLARIMDCSTITNGEIMDQCIWARDGANNILIPLTSDIYQEYLESTKKRNTSFKISMKDVKPGDTIKFATENDDEEYVYTGRFWVVQVRTDLVAEGLEEYRAKIFDDRINQRYFFYKKEEDFITFKVLTTPKIGEIVDKKPQQVFSDAAINSLLGPGAANLVDYKGTTESISMVSSKKIIAKDIIASFVPADPSIIANLLHNQQVPKPRWCIYDYSWSVPLFKKVGDQMYLVLNSHPERHLSWVPTRIIDKNKIPTHQMVFTSGTGSYAYRACKRTDTLIPSEHRNDRDWYQLKLTHGETEAVVGYWGYL